MAKKSTKAKFPKEIYVVKEQDGDHGYFLADDDPGALAYENGDREIGVYQLVRLAKVRNRTEIVDD